MCVRLRIFSDRENAPLGALARARSFVPRLTNGPSPHFNALCINQFCRNCRAPTRHFHHHSFHFPLSLSLSFLLSSSSIFSSRICDAPSPQPPTPLCPLAPVGSPVHRQILRAAGGCYRHRHYRNSSGPTFHYATHLYIHSYLDSCLPFFFFESFPTQSVYETYNPDCVHCNFSENY